MPRRIKTLIDVQTTKSIGFPFIMVNTNSQQTLDLESIAILLTRIIVTSGKVKVLKKGINMIPDWSNVVIHKHNSGTPENLPFPQAQFGVFYTTADPPNEAVIAELIKEWNVKDSKRLWF